MSRSWHASCSQPPAVLSEGEVISTCLQTPGTLWIVRCRGLPGRANRTGCHDGSECRRERSDPCRSGSLLPFGNCSLGGFLCCPRACPTLVAFIPAGSDLRPGAVLRAELRGYAPPRAGGSHGRWESDHPSVGEPGAVRGAPHRWLGRVVPTTTARVTVHGWRGRRFRRHTSEPPSAPPR